MSSHSLGVCCGNINVEMLRLKTCFVLSPESLCTHGFFFLSRIYRTRMKQEYLQVKKNYSTKPFLTPQLPESESFFSSSPHRLPNFMWMHFNIPSIFPNARPFLIPFHRLPHIYPSYQHSPFTASPRDNSP